MTPAYPIEAQRLYGHLSSEGGKRYLVERLWPRGVKRQSLEIDAWLRDVAPSPELRKWYAHDVGLWDEFVRRYYAELDAAPDAWQPLLEAAKEGPVQLLYSARDTEHNSAVALRDYLERHRR